ncbi:MAG: electron transfer flavoprotein subunit beta, partial [Chloroflexota bacterium]|nr:electron transfer flavoprotein subunit beta [Chloroflexota bacterium]
IMAARSKTLETKSLADVPIDGDAPFGGEASTTVVLGSEAPPPRAATRVIREPADEAARQVVEFLAERRII